MIPECGSGGNLQDFIFIIPVQYSKTKSDFTVLFGAIGITNTIALQKRQKSADIKLNVVQGSDKYSKTVPITILDVHTCHKNHNKTIRN